MLQTHSRVQPSRRTAPGRSRGPWTDSRVCLWAAEKSSRLQGRPGEHTGEQRGRVVRTENVCSREQRTCRGVGTVEEGQLGVELQVPLAEGQRVRLGLGGPQGPPLSTLLLQQHRHHLTTRGTTPHNRSPSLQQSPGVCYLSRCVLPVQVCVTRPGVCYPSRCVLPVQVCYLYG